MPYRYEQQQYNRFVTAQAQANTNQQNILGNPAMPILIRDPELISRLNPNGTRAITQDDVDTLQRTQLAHGHLIECVQRALREASAMREGGYSDTSMNDDELEMYMRVEDYRTELEKELESERTINHSEVDGMNREDIERLKAAGFTVLDHQGKEIGQ